MSSLPLVRPPTQNSEPPPSILPEAQRALEHYAQPDATKVIVRFKATGNAPVLQNTYAKITAGQKFQAVIKYLRTQLGFSASDSLFLYINSSFSPNPDDTVIGLYKSFQVDKQLIVNYSTTVAWG